MTRLLTWDGDMFCNHVKIMAGNLILWYLMVVLIETWIPSLYGVMTFSPILPLLNISWRCSSGECRIDSVLGLSWQISSLGQSCRKLSSVQSILTGIINTNIMIQSDILKWGPCTSIYIDMHVITNTLLFDSLRGHSQKKNWQQLASLWR